MMVLLRVIAFVAGATVVLGTLASAVKTVVMPRAEPSLLARWVFVSVRKVFDWRVRRAKDWTSADRVMARFAPFSLVLLPGVWMAAVIAGFVPVYWALGVDGWGQAVRESGSSALTLGFATDTHYPAIVATFV